MKNSECDQDVLYEMHKNSIILLKECGRAVSKEASLCVSCHECSSTEIPEEQEAMGTNYIHYLPLAYTGISELLMLFSELNDA